MSDSPDLILDALRDVVSCHHESWVVRTQDLNHVLKMLDHQDAQLVALRKLVAKNPPPGFDGETICQEADRLVSLDRQEKYGHPRDNMGQTGALWEPILGLAPGAIGPEKVAMCMIAVKLSRLCHGFSRDSVVDIAGYAKCLDLIEKAKPL